MDKKVDLNGPYKEGALRIIKKGNPFNNQIDRK